MLQFPWKQNRNSLTVPPLRGIDRRKRQDLQRAEWCRGVSLSPPSDAPRFRCPPCLKIKMDCTCHGSHSGSCQATRPGNRTEGKPAAPSNPTQGLPAFQYLAFHHSTPSAHSISSALPPHSVHEPMAVSCQHCWNPPEALTQPPRQLAGMPLLPAFRISLSGSPEMFLHFTFTPFEAALELLVFLLKRTKRERSGRLDWRVTYTHKILKV